jgi:hypothetical protein
LIANNAGDTLSGLAGDDTLTGGTGSDILIGGSGADTLNGGLGTDTASYAGSTSAVTVSLVTGVTGIGGDAAGDKLSNIENLIGSSYNDTLTGDTGNNILDGGQGNDSMAGGAGNDTYIINSTGDTITESANAGTDTIRISGINSFNLSAIQAANIETLDLKSDVSANNVTLSATSIQNLVSSGNSSVLTLRLGSEDLFTVDTATTNYYTQGQSLKFYSEAAHTNLIAQVNFTYV